MKENVANANGNSNVGPGTSDSALLTNLAALPKGIKPANDPWQKIANRIALEQFNDRPGRALPGASWHKAWLALAASVFLVAISSLFLTRRSDDKNPVYQPMAVNQEPVAEIIPDLDEQVTLVPATSVDREYQAAFKEFVHLNAAEFNASALAGEEIVRSWQLMHQVEIDLLAAMAREPESPLLMKRLLQLRARQLQLLQVIADSGRAPRRNLI